MGISDMFKALSDPLRRNILLMLRDERMTAGDIAQKSGISAAALSYHLRLLKSADLVSEYKHKNFVYYELNTTIFQDLLVWLNQFGGESDEKQDSLGTDIVTGTGNGHCDSVHGGPSSFAL